MQVNVMIRIITYNEFISSDVRGKIFWTAFLAAFSLERAAL